VSDEIVYRLTFAQSNHEIVRSPVLAASLLLLACAPKAPEKSADNLPQPVALRPLERMTGQPVVVFPVQYLTGTDSLGWARQIPNRAAFLDDLDGQIEAALAARGLGRTWTFGREVERASRLNSIVMTVARSLSAEWLRGRLLDDQTVREPLASQVRGLVGLKGQRYAILPVELRLETRNGMGVAILRLVLIDSRMAQMRWVGEVPSDPMRVFSPALLASVAAHFADLVVAP
jgi:hypothetical protein